MHLKPKKSLGQNFLIDKNIQSKIIDACHFNPQDIVLEIGSGRGELTGSLAKKVKKIFALEIDPSLIGILKINLNRDPNVKLINADILKFDFEEEFKHIKKIKVIGNIPYYICTPIIERLFKFREKISEVFITVQKEFAKRIIARPGSKDYGRLSCFAQYYSEPKIMFNIKKGSFFPIPKVDSCILYLDMKKRLILKKNEEKLFFELIKAAFSKRRKTLRNSLRGIIPQEKLELFFENYKIEPNTRPESLSLVDFLNLTNIYLLEKSQKKG